MPSSGLIRSIYSMRKDVLEGIPWASKFHGLRLWRMRKIVKSVFPFQVFPFVRYKILLTFSIIFYFVSLFLFLFFGEKDDVLFPNAVQRNVQSFTLSSAVQYYSQSFHETRTSISAKIFIPQKSPYFSGKPRTRNSRTNGLKQNEWSFPVVWSREGGWRGEGGRD